jgi:putative flippase GtrA
MDCPGSTVIGAPHPPPGPAWLEKSRPLRFVLAGVVNTGFSYGVYALALWAGLALAWSSLLSLVAGLAIGYLTQGRFVFRAPSAGSLARYVLGWACLFGVHYGVVSGLMRVGVHPLAGALVALVVIASLSYFVLRDLVFRPDSHQTNSL